MTVGSHQTPIGKENERFTPVFIVRPLGPFDTDVCTGAIRPFDIAARSITKEENSLSMDWRQLGRKWCNPPFHRYLVGEFVNRMCAAGNGTMLLHTRTDTKWFQPIWDTASAILWLAGRVIFLKADGSPATIEKPTSKHYGKHANSGAPVALIAFGAHDMEVLHAATCRPEYRGERLVWPDGRLPGSFHPLRFDRFVLGACLDSAVGETWREVVSEWLRSTGEPVHVSELYAAFRDHPKTQSNPNWKAKLRQTLQRGAGVSVGRDQWVAA